MTLFRIDHALVMDTDDIPGRGGYSVVGISRDVTPAERAFVAGNFGISDYLHDPKTEKRIFYSSFRVPGGRRALVRRFARGVRRNQTQNRLYVHTLFFDDELLRVLQGLPWLLVNANVRLEGAAEWERLRDEIPWALDGTSLPALEWDDRDGLTNDIVARLNTRLTSIGNQLSSLPGGASSPSDLVARVIGALSKQDRVLLPQGSAHELVTMLAWSMLPPRDREEIAWTQHDAANISGIVFPLANVVVREWETNLSAPAAPFAKWVVDVNIASEESRRSFHERSAFDGITVRDAHDIDAWQRWRNALERLGKDLERNDPAGAAMHALAKAAEGRSTAPWINGHEVLDLLWPRVLHAAERKPATVVVHDWGKLVHESGLGAVIFRNAPDRHWLSRASSQIRADALVAFFGYAAGVLPDAKFARASVASWLVDANPREVDPETIARLAIPLATDRSHALPALLDRALATNAGLVAFQESLGVRRDVADLVAAAVPIVLERNHPGTIAFLRDAVVPRAGTSQMRVTPELARSVGAVLREEPETFLRFHARLAPEAGAELMETVVKWMFHEPEQTRALARALMQRIQSDPAALETANRLAIAMANAGEPASLWFEVVLRLARAHDSRNDEAGTRAFLDTLDKLRARPLKLAGAIDPLLFELQSNPRPGRCVRALVLFVRSEWKARAHDLLLVLAGIVGQAPLTSAWQDVVVAFVEDHARSQDLSALILAFWRRIDPEEIPRLRLDAIETTAQVSGAARKKLIESWPESRIVRIPASKNSDRFIALLTGESATPAVRTALDRRELEQQIATVGTLNRLDRSSQGTNDYASGMAAAIEQFIDREGNPVNRLVRLLELLLSDDVVPTVKLIATQRVLPRAAGALSRSQWATLLESATDGRLLARGAASLAVAFRAGVVASPSTIEGLERIYDRHRRADLPPALDAGWASRSPLKSFARLLGFHEVKSSDGRPLSM